MSTCAFAWCSEDRPDHPEHTWTDGVLGSTSIKEQRRAYVWTSLQDGYDEPILVGVEQPGNDSGEEAWLSLEAAEQFRDALTLAIEHAREWVQK